MSGYEEYKEPEPEPGPRAVPDNFREVRIQKVINGYIIKVGCRTFIARCWTEASFALQEYFIDPSKAEAKYSEEYFKFVN